MPEPANLVTEKDIRLFIKHMNACKAAGWGDVHFKVADKNIVFAEHSEGEQIKMILDSKQ
jgi:hypothetical protein